MMQPLVHSHPDDPYVTTITEGVDGITIAVEADVLLVGGEADTAAVEAECTRRATLLRDMLVNMMRPRP